MYLFFCFGTHSFRFYQILLIRRSTFFFSHIRLFVVAKKNNFKYDTYFISVFSWFSFSNFFRHPLKCIRDHTRVIMRSYAAFAQSLFQTYIEGKKLEHFAAVLYLFIIIKSVCPSPVTVFSNICTSSLLYIFNSSRPRLWPLRTQKTTQN